MTGFFIVLGLVSLGFAIVLGYFRNLAEYEEKQRGGGGPYFIGDNDIGF